MKYAIKLYTALSLVFILLLSVSGSFSGILSDVIYIIAFVAPALIGLYLSKVFHRMREEEAGVSLENKWYYTLDAAKVKLLSPLVMPAILVVMLVSFLTTLVLNAFGISSAQIEITSLPRMLVMHALAPALLEELLFRYLPMKLILPYSKRACIVISSLYFAFIHCSLFSIPYALVAGALFISLDIAFDSVLPSLILHFLNNAMSVIMVKYCDSVTSYAIYLGACLVLLVVSLIFIYRFKDKYKEILKDTASDMGSIDAGYYPLLLLIPTLLIAVVNLF